ncbi:MAG: hypothetical protein PWQ82_1136 [Thermosediminibacterales bacterium]|nr:hypothetical protein [Thermosediminibacterales bacterium]MDK2835670.1 hypothetical protein [Thermosediminibacterales bacterium]
MSLTNRRKDFLKVILDEYQRTKTPVHYVTVAERLGISKWTAYDVMKQLEEKGFLEAEYQVSDERTPGRSVILFVPTKKSKQVFKNEENHIQIKQWPEVRQNLLNRYYAYKKYKSKEIIENTLKEMAFIELPFLFSAYTVALFTLHLLSFEIKNFNYIREVVSVAPTPETGLIFFTGAVLGVLLKTSSGDNTHLKDFINRFQHYLKEISYHEKKILADFLKETLNSNLEIAAGE